MVGSWRAAGLTLGLLVLTAPPSHAGPFVGETSVYARESGFEQHFFYGTSGNANGKIEYICRAFPGTTGSDSTASAVWQVQLLTYNSSGNLTDMEFAGDDDKFDQVCDNRASLNYD